MDVDVFDGGWGAHEQVVMCQDQATGLKAIIAIHSTVLGASLGGTRWKPYDSTADALVDVLRLSRAMTYKSAAAGLDLGGGKAVIVGDPAKDRSDEFLRTYARFVHSLSGRYITAEDVGSTMADMDFMCKESPYVAGISEALGGSGDPSPVTSIGVFSAVKATAKHLWGDESLEGKHICVSGVGKVGSELARHLAAAGARLTLADILPESAQRVAAETGAEIVDVDKVHAVACDIFSPCALGGILNSTTIPELSCSAIVGAANNQLATPEDAEALRAAGILYVPDYIANAGGVINIACEADPGGYDGARARQRVSENIFASTTDVLEIAAREGITTAKAADRRAESRLEAARATPRIRTFPKETPHF
ncbi:MAG TPA: Glu/Leu/Phe/Val dehydrogenase [Acidimicrobiales bacterium]|nr:Glu/Leu/Phe/Val dehydrogenase [Acidimicrobiales bacterium]